MSRIIKSGLIQMSLPMTEGEGSIQEIVDAMVQKHIPYIEDAGRQGVQILCLQEIFNTPYFCPGQDKFAEVSQAIRLKVPCSSRRCSPLVARRPEHARHLCSYHRGHR